MVNIPKSERSDVRVPSTLEMDKLIKDEDVENRHFIMKPCIECGQYTKQDIRIPNKACVYCGGEMGKASTHWASIRTFNPLKKISLADRKKMGGSAK